MGRHDPFSTDLASHQPETFARVLAQGDFDDIGEVLDALPVAVSAAVAAHLPQSFLKALLAREPRRVKAWLESGAFDVAVAIIRQVPREQRSGLLDDLADRTRRRRLLQFLHYPQFSVGSQATQAILRVSHQLGLSELRSQLQAVTDEANRPAVLVEKDGKYLGVLDLWRVSVHGSKDQAAGTYADPVPALRPEWSIMHAREAEAWRHHAWLPVVDHENRILGAVSRNRIFAPSMGRRLAGGAIQDNLTSLGQQFFRVMPALLGWLLGRRTST